MEAFSIIALFANPVHEIQPQIPPPAIHFNEEIVSESLKIDLRQAWREFRAGEAIQISA